ncbi:Eco57I restriction-modification methylase domain-containing protein [Hymenobacter sp. BT186]|uniref:site-specific DNA-methyltransferase (adenine-specific) n=1 Tax=Hymenobacter telluris TaxID=2816474 RepID=A0A939F2B4_9BACT|nr:DNA methyltransferase [Hymenobacter telluris]MBO0360098.1 Eco57I restriction-modification methylase domain-containing protein [Hymenobacter telluris]MBW3376125.1 Eco57I restriction-modification methylase domain-containing protein [Hymenobacter norwichensis]
MPTLLPLFPAATLPAPFTPYDPAAALPDFAERVRHLRRWQQAIASGYVRSHKEEALQAEFLNLLFGQVLGYEYQATTHRQLQLELKTLTDGTKPDGALGDFVAAPGGSLGGPVRAVVELKDARTALDAKQRGGAGKGRQETPVEQAFSYPSKFGGQCRWVLVSNFVELRLYAAQDQSRAEVFNLETLPDQPEQLRRFFALLLPAHLLPPAGRAEAPLDEALQQRQQEEMKITKAFYKDYSAARRQLLDHLIEQNPAVPPLELLAHTQKLLDRVIFVCFCEDKNIIPRLTFRRLLDAVRQNVFDPADDKVYRTVRGLFRSIDEGNPAANINRFNGGLFAADAALDALVIKDRTLTPVIQLEQYDFASDLNVNILGHIFEQSLSDLEVERARLTGQDYNAKQGKRKQDGIFYTPEYITRYMVRQAVGGWLQERRREAGLDALPDLTDDDRATIRLGVGNRLVQPSRTVQKHIAAWETYATALENIRVLDPACGSGAFLNEAFGYLLREGQHVNQELAALRAGQATLFDFDRHILQHNLYGVDLNPESVDITRLSLWLQTANPGKPLTSLDHSIRCGNSLISDATVAGPRAFDWHAAFPEVFAQGGFDVVIGNPPYVRVQNISKSEMTYYYDKYTTPIGKLDISILFFEKAINLISENSIISFISSSQWMQTDYGKNIRRLLSTGFLRRITDFGSLPVFEDADAYPAIFVISNSINNSFEYKQIKNKENLNYEFINSFTGKLIDTSILHESVWTFEGFDLNQSLVDKNIIFSPLSKLGKAYIGNKTGWDAAFIVDTNTIKDLQLEDSIILPYAYRGEEVSRYTEVYPAAKVIYPYRSNENGNPILIPVSELENDYPNIFKYLSRFKKELMARLDSRKLYAFEHNFYRHMRAGSFQYIEAKKILLKGIDTRPQVGILSEGSSFNGSNCPAIILNEGYKNSISFVLAILNSKTAKYYLNHISPPKLGNYYRYNPTTVSKLPIPNISPAEQQPFIAAAEALLAGHKELHEAEANAGRLVQAELGLTAPLTGKLALAQPWKTWSTALSTALGRKLTLAEKGEWLPYLEQFQQQQQQRRAALQRQDAALDQLVYQLYQLTPAEIALVEGP